jgi:hypothetical protein
MLPMRKVVPLGLIAIALSTSACDEAPPALPSTLPAPTFGTSVIRGTIRFLGTPPERRMIDTSSCHAGARAYQEETLVVGPDQGLRDVIVYLKDVPASDGSARPAAQLDQVDCAYTPHVLALQVNQKLMIKTSDPVFHNVHWVSRCNGDVNLNMPPNAPAEVVRFAQPEFFRVRCDVHTWMESFIGVMPSPFFAVTKADGSFEIPRVPAGRYTLATWHPLLGEQTQPIDVAPDGTLTIVLDYAPPP